MGLQRLAQFLKFISKIVARAILVRDANCIHHFEDGCLFLHELFLMPVVMCLVTHYNKVWDGRLSFS